MKKYLFLLFCITGLSLLGGCEEERAGFWKGGNRIRFATPLGQMPSDDYTTMNPVSGISGTTMLNPGTQESTVYYRLQVVGEIADVPRTAKLEWYIDEEDTQPAPVEGLNFVWTSEIVVPAGEYTVDFPITIKRDPAGGYKSFKLYFRLVESEDFKITDSHYKAVLNFQQMG